MIDVIGVAHTLIQLPPHAHRHIRIFQPKLILCSLANYEPILIISPLRHHPIQLIVLLTILPSLTPMRQQLIHGRVPQLPVILHVVLPSADACALPILRLKNKIPVTVVRYVWQ